MKARLVFTAWVASLLLTTIGNGADAGVGTNTGFADHLAQLNRKVPEGFTVVVRPAFVVIGDEPRAHHGFLDSTQSASFM